MSSDTENDRMLAAVGKPDDSELGTLADQALLQRSRSGDPEAYAELFRRHWAVAVCVASRTSSALDPQEVAAEAFTRVWGALRRGVGPELAFRSYLAATVRNVALNLRRGVREVPIEPLLLEAGAGPGTEAAGVEGDLVSLAFAGLPERWRHALWVTEVEGRSVRELAEALGTSPNTASALCLRAREGLRVAWLQRHVPVGAASSECRWTLDRLGSLARARLAAGQLARVRAHLAACPPCAAIAERITALAALAIGGHPPTTRLSPT